MDMPSKYKITETDALIGATIEREANADEIAEFKADEAAAVLAASEAEAKATAKAALLERLGITEEEAALLVG